MNPAVVGCTLLLLGFILILTNRDGVGKWRMVGLWLSCLALAWSYVWSISAFTRFVGGMLEKEFLVDGRWPSADGFSVCDAIIDMGGGIGADTNQSDYVCFNSSGRPPILFI